MSKMGNCHLKRLSIIVCQLLIATILSAQTIEINLPSCLGQPYVFCLAQGAKQDTILIGKMAEQGKTIIVLPEEYASYRGVGSLSIQNCKSLNIVLNGESKIEINEKRGFDDFEVLFDQSEENGFMEDMIARQQQLIEKYQLIRSGLPLWQMKDVFYVSLRQEQMNLERQYFAHQTEISQSPLYAARLIEILSCLTGTGNSLNQPQEAVRFAQQKFIAEKLDFDDLYTSGFWQLTMDFWHELNMEDDALLLSDSRKMLDRINDIYIRRELTQSLIRLFSQYGKDYLLAELGTEYLTMPLNGQLAPEIQIGETSFLPKNSLLVFYETGCGSCHNELEMLKNRYSLLADNQIRVISISADISQEVFEYTSSGFLWEDKICDFDGFDGVNFRNYGIVGTPTFILTDKEGIVRGRYAQLKELLKD